MLFNSAAFLAFFSVFYAGYVLVRRHRRTQNVLLLVASYYFYGFWDWRFAGLIALTTLIDFSAGLAIERHKKGGRQDAARRILQLCLAANLGLLGFFKYYNFFAESFAAAMNSLGWQPGNLTLEIILPVGISFYTFQTLSYTIDIYRRQLEPARASLNT